MSLIQFLYVIALFIDLLADVGIGMLKNEFTTNNSQFFWPFLLLSLKTEKAMLLSRHVV